MSIRSKATVAKSAIQHVDDPGLQKALITIVDLILEVGKNTEDISDTVNHIKRNQK